MNSKTISFALMSFLALAVLINNTGQNLVLNGDFSQNSCRSDYCIFTKGNSNFWVLGWTPQPQIEVGKGSVYNTRFSRNEWVTELDPDSNSCIYQDLGNLNSGIYTLSFQHAARQGKSISDSQFSVIIEGLFSETISHTNYNRQSKNFNINVANSYRNVVLRLCGVGSSTSYGAIITNISFRFEGAIATVPAPVPTIPTVPTAPVSTIPTTPIYPNNFGYPASQNGYFATGPIVPSNGISGFPGIGLSGAGFPGSVPGPGLSASGYSELSGSGSGLTESSSGFSGSGFPGTGSAGPNLGNFMAGSGIGYPGLGLVPSFPGSSGTGFSGSGFGFPGSGFSGSGYLGSGFPIQPSSPVTPEQGIVQAPSAPSNLNTGGYPQNHKIPTASTSCCGRELITNGDFQNHKCHSLFGYCIYDKFNNTLYGWRTTTYIQIGKAHIYNPAIPTENNNTVLELDPKDNTCVTQQVKSCGQGQYVLRFNYAARKNKSLETSGFRIGVNTDIVKTIRPTSYDYLFAEFNIKLKAGQNTIHFCGQGKGDSYGIAIDNVSLMCCEHW